MAPGNLIAAPLQGQRKANGLTLFLDPATLEPYDDQWLFLSTLDRLSPGDAQRVARLAKRALVGNDVTTMSRSDAPACSHRCHRRTGGTWRWARS